MKMIEKLSRILDERGWKDAPFEREARLHKNRVGRWRDNKGEPSAMEVVRMARLLGVPLDYLADDEIDDISQAKLPASIDPNDAQILLDAVEVIGRLVGKDRWAYVPDMPDPRISGTADGISPDNRQKKSS